MSQDPEKYLYFSVGLLRGSPALNALWQDALRYHMIDQPGQLIAMRLTEYYELLASGNVPSMAPVAATPPASALPPPPEQGANQPQPSSAFNRFNRERTEGVSIPANTQKEKGESTLILNNVVATNSFSQQPGPATQETFASSTGAEQNAEEAADYWKLL